MTATIALVDDDRNILTSVSIALQAEGFLTRVYSDGETALKAVADDDNAALDPGKMQELMRKQLGRTGMPKAPVAGNDADIDMDKLMKDPAAMQDYIRKQLDPESRKLLAQSSSSAWYARISPST